MVNGYDFALPVAGVTVSVAENGESTTAIDDAESLTFGLNGGVPVVGLIVAVTPGGNPLTETVVAGLPLLDSTENAYIDSENPLGTHTSLKPTTLTSGEGAGSSLFLQEEEIKVQTDSVINKRLSISLR